MYRDSANSKEIHGTKMEKTAIKPLRKQTMVTDLWPRGEDMYWVSPDWKGIY